MKTIDHLQNLGALSTNISKISHRYYTSVSDFSSNEMFALKRIHYATSENKPFYANELDDLPINKSAISQMLTNLEKKELITRVHSKTDRRKIEIYLTEEGKRSIEQSFDIVKDLWTRVISKLGTDKLEQITLLLTELQTILEEEINEITDKEIKQ